jgi:hypothetical protein
MSMSAKQNFPINRGHIQLIFVIIGLFLLFLVPFLYHQHPPKVNSVKTASARFNLEPTWAAAGSFNTFSHAGSLALPKPTIDGSKNQAPATASVEIASDNLATTSDDSRADDLAKPDKDKDNGHGQESNKPADSTREKVDK